MVVADRCFSPGEAPGLTRKVVPPPLDKFREMTRVFDPIYRPYSDAQDGPGASYVAEIHEDFRRQFEASLQLNENAKLLVAGQPGCGKTTMLRSMVQWLRAQGRVAVFVDLEAQTAVQDLGLVEMHLVAAAEILAGLGLAQCEVSGESLGACADWIRQVDPSEPVATPLEPNALAAEFRRVLTAARDSADLRHTLRMQVSHGGERDPLQLLGRLLGDLRPRQPVVVLDGLDKLPPEQAREFFLNDKRKPMAETPGAAILTIPLSVVYEPGFNVLSERYNNADSAVLPAVRLYDFDPVKRERVRSKRGFEVLRRIIEARVAPIDSGIVMHDAVERAIEGSGGNIRELARLMQASIVKSYVRQGGFIERQDVEAAIADQRESFRRAYQPRFLPVLKKVREEFQLENADDIGKLLLYGLWVVEYRNGTTWYSVPASVEQLLDQLGSG